MNTKLLVALLLVMLATPAFAAITVTINKPSANTVINNLWQESIDINFSGTDNNTGVQAAWRYVDINYYSDATLPNSGTAIVADGNLYDWELNGNSGQTCDIDANGATFSCNYRWTLPKNTTMGDADYFINVNVYDLNGSETEVGNHVTADKNATNAFQVSTKLAGGQSIRNLMAIVGMVLAALVLIGGLVAMVGFKTDPTSTAIVTVVGAIAVAIGSQIIGTVLATL